MRAALPLIDAAMSAADARAVLERAGWRLVGTGDWSWVYADPSDEVAARVAPWDRAYRMHAELCLVHPNRYLQRIFRIDALRDGGHVVYMQRLWPADPARAEAFCVALKLGNDSGYELAAEPDGLAAFEADADLDSLRALVGDASARGAAEIPFWGGSDIRPGNVMADAAGQLKLIDPLFVSGPTIIAAIQAGQRERLAAIPRAALAAFLTIPAFDDGAEPLRQALRDMDLID
jgi:hypothetical protein